MSLLIQGGLVVDPAQALAAPRDLLIEGGKIAALEAPGTISAEGRRVIAARNLVVTPGLIDMHVHLREPGEEYKETILTGTQAAAAGGFTAVAAMPNTRPVNDNSAVTRFIREAAQVAGAARVYPVGAISMGSLGQTLSEYGDQKAAGAVAFSDDGHPVMNPMLMRRALEYARTFDVPLIAHEEDLDLRANGVMHEGRVSLELGLRGIPAAAEEAMIFRDLALLQLTGGRLHIAHVSAFGSVALIRTAKAAGLTVTAETAPHYFSLTDEAVYGLRHQRQGQPAAPDRGRRRRHQRGPGGRDAGRHRLRPRPPHLPGKRFGVRGRGLRPHRPGNLPGPEPQTGARRGPQPQPVGGRHEHQPGPHPGRPRRHPGGGLPGGRHPHRPQPGMDRGREHLRQQKPQLPL